MIKESKDKQREKNGSNAAVKTELPSSQGQNSETAVKEEPGTESHVNGGEEGDSSCKKNGVRVSGGNSATGSSSSCGHADIKPSLIGSTNTGTVTMGPVRSSSATHITSELCLVDGAQEGEFLVYLTMVYERHLKSLWNFLQNPKYFSSHMCWQ